MLDCSLSVTVGSGSAVTFRFTVANASDEPVELTFPDSGRAEFVVYAEDGEEVWRWSEGRAFTQAIEHSDLQPGQEAVVEESWPDAEPGDYTAEASLRCVDADASARTPFSV
jgi:hypothetical protein